MIYVRGVQRKNAIEDRSHGESRGPGDVGGVALPISRYGDQGRNHPPGMFVVSCMQNLRGQSWNTS